PVETFKYKGKFDLIFSNSVLEHVSDVNKTIIRMNNLLDEEGTQVHCVMVSDHGILSEKFHPFEYLTLNNKLWSMMVKHSGHPNRVLLPEFKRLFLRKNMSFNYYKISIYGLKEKVFLKDLDPNLIGKLSKKFKLKQIRKRFVSPYFKYSDEDLLSKRFLFLSQKIKGYEK
ncbi:class I SAM-dependent methyltransferase, partial [Candidatus Woesearchaeota archaeon]|nr:class I SAM-dependent methyltransferase [Candidatus Woesearchaeota archaeon]